MAYIKLNSYDSNIYLILFLLLFISTSQRFFRSFFFVISWKLIYFVFSEKTATHIQNILLVMCILACYFFLCYWGTLFEMSNLVRILQIRKIQLEFAMHEFLSEGFSSYYVNSFKRLAKKKERKLKLKNFSHRHKKCRLIK